MKTPIVVRLLLVLLALCLVTGPGCRREQPARCPHDIKPQTCPFCTPQLVESEGFCGEHGVAEALCVVCRPYLRPAFKARGDWCQTHQLPDSQCLTCHPELREQIRPGEHNARP